MAHGARCSARRAAAAARCPRSATGASADRRRRRAMPRRARARRRRATTRDAVAAPLPTHEDLRHVREHVGRSRYDPAIRSDSSASTSYGRGPVAVHQTLRETLGPGAHAGERQARRSRSPRPRARCSDPEPSSRPEPDRESQVHEPMNAASTAEHDGRGSAPPAPTARGPAATAPPACIPRVWAADGRRLKGACRHPASGAGPIPAPGTRQYAGAWQVRLVLAEDNVLMREGVRTLHRARGRPRARGRERGPRRPPEARRGARAPTSC